MPAITVSPKFQVVIPKIIREQMALVPGQKLQATLIDGRIELVPVEPLAALRGALPGLDTRIDREDDRV